MMTSIAIAPEEHADRCAALLAHAHAEGLAGVVLFDPTYVLYYSGFAFVPTERPIAFVLGSDGTRALVVPRLELEHAESRSTLDRVEYYLEYPGDPRAEDVLAKTVRDLGLTGTIGADQDGYPWILGYRGPTLSELADATVTRVADRIEAQMAIKSEAEVALVRESVRWANLAHRLLQRYTSVGATETEVSQRASDEATFSMLDAIGEIYRAQSPFSTGAHAGYRGQIGRNSAIPHALAGNLVFEEGDVLVTGASAPVWGYLSELERTMFVGEPTGEQERMFAHMLGLQDLAFAAIRPGARCRDVDETVRAYFDDHGLWPLWRHHTGHAIGLRYHEGPFLDSGDDTEIRPGMVFTVEPGLYSPELGGFRHSDTVLVTESGTEILTYYPRDLASLIIPV
ncbi:MAG TPA: Xaa-Pro peptidase family protein [Gaiellaceae bacterium]|nr:Xaa-Pro peptidase family protein [Gaiellaceae bacterium]